MLGDEFAFYTLIPRVRDPSNLSWSDSCCNGNWKVRNGNDWVTLLPTNTRVRDAENKRWVEICQGHVVVASSNAAYPYDCRAYSIVADELRSSADSTNKDLDIAVAQDSIFGAFLDIHNGASSIGLVYVAHDSQVRLHLRYATTYVDIALVTIPNTASVRVNLTACVSLSGDGDTYMVDCRGVRYTVALNQANGWTWVSESPWSAPPFTTIQTTNSFASPYPSSSSFANGVVSATVAGRGLVWPTSSSVSAFLASTPAQTYLVEVYESEIHFAKLSLNYALSN